MVQSPPLRANRTSVLTPSDLVVIYLNADSGDDNNPGNTPGLPFRTNARAALEIGKYTFAGGIIAITYGAGTINPYDKLELGDAYGNTFLKGSSGEIHIESDSLSQDVVFDPDGGNGGMHFDIPLSLDLEVRFTGFACDFGAASQGIIIDGGKKVDIRSSSEFTTQEITLTNNKEIVFDDGNIFTNTKIAIDNCANINLGFPGLDSSYIELVRVSSGQVNRIDILGASNSERILKFKDCQNLKAFGDFSIPATATDIRAYEIIDCDRIDVDFDFQGTAAGYTGSGIPIKIENSTNLTINGTSDFSYTGVPESIEIDALSSVKTDDGEFEFLPYDGSPKISNEADINNNPGIIKTVTQLGHSLVLPAHKFIPVYQNIVGLYVPAIVTEAENSIAKAFIVGIPDTNTLEILDQRAIIEVGSHGLTQGINYFLGLSPGAISNRKTAPIYQKIARVISATKLEFLIDDVNTGQIRPLPGNAISLNPNTGSDLNDGFSSAVATFERVEEILESFDWGETTATINVAGAVPTGDLDCTNIKAERIRILGSGGVILSDELAIRNFNGFSFTIQSIVLSGNARLTINNCSNIIYNSIDVANFTRTGGIILASSCRVLTMNGVTIDGASGVNLSSFFDLTRVLVSSIDISITSSLTCSQFMVFRQGCLYAEFAAGGTNGFLTGRAIAIFDNGVMQLENTVNYAGSAGNIVGDTNIVDGSDFDEGTNNDFTATTKTTAIIENRQEIKTLQKDRQIASEPASNNVDIVFGDGSPNPTAYSLIDGLTLPPLNNTAVTTYMIRFSIVGSSSSNNRTIRYALYVNGVESTEFALEHNYRSSDVQYPANLEAPITSVPVGAVIDIRARNQSNPATLTQYARTLIATEV